MLIYVNPSIRPQPSSAGQQPFAHGRLMVRLLTEMHIGCNAEGMRVFDGELDRAIIFMVVARESGPLSLHSGGQAQSGGAGQGISVNALAASLSRPFETMRRHANALLAKRLCVRTPGGLIVPGKVHARPEIDALFRLQHDALVRLIEDMAAFEIPLPETRAHVPYDWHTGLAAAHDVLLSGIEFYSRRYESWIDMLLLGAVMCANARPFTYQRDVSLAYADFTRLPPESMRAPVPASVIARVLNLPPSTTQRRINAMIDAGKLTRKPAGLMVTERALNDATAIADARNSTDHTRQILTRLAAAGFRFDDPALCYLAGRPALTAFD
jgi:hypothetical protein